MISFACKKCGKPQSRPESQAGTLVFCDCGQGCRVPWQSDTVPAAIPPSRPRPVLEAEPASPVPPLVEPPLPSRRPGRLLGKVNPNFCLQHDDDPSEEACAACRLPFCKRCVVRLQGQTLCGSCKNFRLAQLGRSRRLLPLAVVAIVTALSSAPVSFILSLAGAGLFQSEGVLGASVALCVLALALPATALVLSSMALRRLDARPQADGRGLAASGVCAALVGVVWCVTVAALLIARHALG